MAIKHQNMKTTKTIFSVITAALLSLFAASCTPTTPAINPTPINSSNIDASYHLDLQSNPTIGLRKTIFLDGDSLSFTMGVGSYATSWYGFALDYYCDINIPFQSDTSEYRLLGSSTSFDLSYATFGALLDSGVTINDNYTDTLYSFAEYPGHTFLVQKNYQQQSVYDQFRFPLNTSKYIVLRKTKPSGNQYYWIKFRREGNYLLDETITAVSGKYQMNSITTGQ